MTTKFEPTATVIELPKSDKYSLILTGFNSLEQVEGFLDWFGNSGEQYGDLYNALGLDVESVSLQYPVETQSDGKSILASVEICEAL